FLSLSGCGKEKDISANREYGKGENIKVMKFYADWCPPCNAMKPEYEQVKKIYPYIVFEEIDFDQDKAKIAQYNIRSIPVVITSKNGKETGRNAGYMSRNDLVKFIEKK
ncbi:MAG: thioredoxin, partial [Candidatus Electrothrix sp. AR3]|nr:thioredoxin [Candidatus Electrothrix sp. AR3]